MVRKTLRRDQVLGWFAQLPSALVGMEACSGARYWARELIKLGHDARIIDSRLVAPYRHSGRVGKNDRNDAEAICEAVGRPNMRFVPVKSEESQAVLTVHRVCESVVAEGTGVANQMRGLLMEFGIVIPKGLRGLRRTSGEVLKRHAERLPSLGVEEFRALYASLMPGLSSMIARSRAWSERSSEPHDAHRGNWSDHGKRCGGHGERCQAL